METGEEAVRKISQATLMKQERGRLQGRIKQSYTDKLDGKISEEMWAESNREWHTEAASLDEKIRKLDESRPHISRRRRGCSNF